MLEYEDVHKVEDVHDAIVDDEPDVEVVLRLILREDVSEGDDPGVVQEADRHHCQPTWAERLSISSQCNEGRDNLICALLLIV